MFNERGNEMNAVVRLSSAQTIAALRRVEPRGKQFTYWTPDDSAPAYATRKEAEEASVQEWRENLNPPADA